MKQITCIISTLLLLATFTLQSQSVGIGTDSPDSSAILDIQSSSKGILIPRMSSSQRTMINDPVVGLLVFDNSTGSFWFYNGSAWDELITKDKPGDQIADADNDTKIQVEESEDDDIIRFDMAGTEYFRMDSGRLEVLNTGLSVFIGKGAGADDDLTNNSNVFIGNLAGNGNTTGVTNTAIGSYSFRDNTTGQSNTSIGSGTMIMNQTGYSNTAVGIQALDANETGYFNTAIGASALDNNLTGTRNTALGVDADVAMYNLTNATAIGYNAKVATSNSLVLGGTGADAVKVGIGTQSPDTTLHIVGSIKMEDGTEGPGKVMISDSNGIASWTSQSALSPIMLGDSDNDTKIQVEEGADDDIIRFDMAGTEFFRMDSTRFEVLNSGQSVFIGEGAGANDDLIVNRNVFVGYQAGTANTSGNDNTAIGNLALSKNTTGRHNTTNGTVALRENTTGDENTAIGSWSLHDNTIGGFNTGIGSDAIRRNTTGMFNTGLGSDVLENNKTGEYNSGIGAYALATNVGGSKNTALGYLADVLTDSLNNATVIGYNAKVATSNSMVLGGTGADAVKVGIGTQSPDTTLHIVGSIKMEDGTEGPGKVMISDSNGIASWTSQSALSPIMLRDSDNDTKIQVEEGADDDIIRFDMAGTEFFRMDSGRLEVLNTGHSIYIGEGAGANDDLSATNNNVFIGYWAGKADSTGVLNTGIGSFALRNTTTGSFNTAIGYVALHHNTTGEHNTAIGSNSLEENTTGRKNTIIGAYALSNNITGNSNTGIGEQALYDNETGDFNTGIGVRALDVNLSGHGNTALGYRADVTFDSLTNATAIGYNAKVGASNSLVLGGTGANAVKVGIGVESPVTALDIAATGESLNLRLTKESDVYGSNLVLKGGGTHYKFGTPGGGVDRLRIWNDSIGDVITFLRGGDVGIGIAAPTHPLHLASGAHCTSGGVWINASDISKKYDLADLGYGLNEIMQLRPAAYKYKTDDSESIGFVAQEIETVIPEVVSGEDGEKGVAYGLITAVLVKGMQEQQEIIEAQQQRISQLETNQEVFEFKLRELYGIVTENIQMKSEIEIIKAALKIEN